MSGIKLYFVADYDNEKDCFIIGEKVYIMPLNFQFLREGYIPYESSVLTSIFGSSKMSKHDTIRCPS